jgi:hypothetical protein
MQQEGKAGVSTLDVQELEDTATGIRGFATATGPLQCPSAERNEKETKANKEER